MAALEEAAAREKENTMSAPVVVTAPITSAKVLNPEALVEQSQDFAAQVFKAVAEAYLGFRREYYHEAQPSLATTPPAHAEIRRSELALLADSTLRLVPGAIKSIPVVGSFLVHLEQVAEMHSISEDERTELHNLTIGFLHGIRGGIQPWYVEWLLRAAHNLSQVRDPNYYFEYPFEGLLYRDPAGLAAFDTAVRGGDVAALQHEIQYLAARLIETLHSPVRAQPLLAFTGPDGERRRLAFNLRTAIGLALVAYLITEEVRLLVHPRQAAMPRSVLPPLPPQLAAQVVDQ
jgi:hypothetical protein